MIPRLRLTRDSSWGFLGPEDLSGGGKWRPLPRARRSANWHPTGGSAGNAVRRFAIRSWGADAPFAEPRRRVCARTHNPTDPSLSTAAGGPPRTGSEVRGLNLATRYSLLFGIGSILFLPVVAIAGLRMLRIEPAGHTGPRAAGRGDWGASARHGARIDERTARFRSSGGMGRSIGLAAAHGLNSGFAMIGNPEYRRTRAARDAASPSACRCDARLFRNGPTVEERDWIRVKFRREPRVRAAPTRHGTAGGSPDCRGPAAGAADRRRCRAGQVSRSGGPRQGPQAARCAAEPGARRQLPAGC